MDQASPTVYRTKSWQARRRALVALGGLGLIMLGYAVGRWQDTPAPAAALPPAPAPVSVPAVASPSPSPSLKKAGFALLQAESATELAGVEVEDTTDQGGGRNVGWINREDHLRFDDYDFGEVPATRAEIRVASDSGAVGRLQIRLDSRDAEPVGEISIGDTGGWQSWRTATAVLQPVTGVHTVFLTFTSDDGTELVNLNWLRFQH
ncbi:carbohydrate-binding protein [Actinoplanes sp. G11-F43]|uniref:carbohydrate-binding protein n=1 Tax=Actinoplanes sp. G11-F43 TaxID=3424130 RepID=UPI003D3372E8